MRYIIILITMLALCCACGNSSKDADKLGIIDVEIPAELKKNKEVVAYIHGMEDVANSYALLIDETLEDIGEYIGVDESELGMMDQLKLVKATGEVTIKSVEIMSKWGECIDKRTELDKQLTDSELQALNQIWEQFDARMAQIDAKYKTDIKSE